MKNILSISNIDSGIRILFPESLDIRILIAAITLKTAGIIEPILIGDFVAILDTFSDWEKRKKYSLGDVNEADIQILKSLQVTPLNIQFREQLVWEYVERKWWQPEDIVSLFPADLVQAASMLKNGMTDGVVAGSIADTKDVIRVWYNSLWLASGHRISGEFLMVPSERSLRNEIYTIGDSAVNPDPSAEQIADIASSLLDTHTTFFPSVAPRVAFLSFSTYESGIGLSVDKMKEALYIFQKRHPDIESDWPLQLDAAIDTDIYIQKTKWKWKLTFPANILVFPTLDAGNLFYKNMERFGWYNAIGPILTGFQYPGWSDLSRGTSIQAIVDMAYVTAIRAQKK